GFSNNKQLLALVESGKLSQSRVDLSVTRLLKEQFELGLFENPYVDPNRAAYIVGNASFQRKADLAQRKSIVLLENKSVLPLAQPKGQDTLQIFTMGMNAALFKDRAWANYKVTTGEYNKSKGEKLPAISKDTDFAIIRVQITNDPGTDRRFGGALPEELNFLSLSEMAKSKSWKISPSLEDIQSVMETLGPEKTILAIDFRQPYVLDEASGVLNAGGLLATFGVSDAALMDIIMGKFNPTGKLPYALAKTSAAVIAQEPDAPGYPEKDTLFPFGFGLNYK
nr:glycoside hydrolase family 3 C-terminal domain-containing protein [Algoriphagus sp.]